MIALLLYLLAAVFPAEGTQVRLDRQQWVVASADNARELTAGETLWWWSPACAPQKLTAGATRTCGETATLEVNVLDPKGRAIENASVVWATDEMLGDLPDNRLPAVLTAVNGIASVRVPKDASVRMRVAGPQFATHWRRIAAGAKSVRLNALPAAVARLRLRGDDGSVPVHARIALLPLQCETLCEERLLAFDDAKDAPAITAVAGATYQALVWSDSHAPLNRTVMLAATQDVALTLAQGAAVTAKIVDADQKPIANAQFDVRYRLPSLQTIAPRTVMTSADGSATLAGLPAAPVEWIASARGYGRRVDSAPLFAGKTNLGKITLTAARNARVAVVDPSDRPVAHATVVARESAVATTDAKGIAAFEQLPVDDVQLDIEAEGFLRAKVPLPRDQRQLTVTLQRGAGVRATLLPEAGGPAPARVKVRITNNGSESVETVDVDDQFVLTGLRGGTLRLRISADDARTYDTGSLTVTDGDILDLGMVMLKSGIVLRGIIVGEDGESIDGARIRILRTDGDAPALAQVLGNWQEVRSADDGKFRLSSLSPGSQLVVIDASGYAQRVIPNVSLEDDSADVDLGRVELSRGRTVQLTCRPARRCGSEASILVAGSTLPQLAIRAPMEDGRATLHAVPPGDTLLRLTRSQQIVHERRIDVPRGTDPETIDIALSSVRVRGEVLVGARRAQGGSLIFERAMQSDSAPILLKSQTPQGSNVGRDWIGSIAATAACDIGSDGNFVVDDLEPGEYNVTFRSAGASASPTRLSVPDVPDHQVQLRFDDHELAGTVFDSDGKPSPAHVEIVDGAGAVHTTSSGIDGQFRLLGVSAGRAKVKASAAGKKAEIEVDPSRVESRNVILRLSAATRGVGVDVEEEGRPASGALVFVITPRGVLVASTDQEGRALFPAIDPAVAPGVDGDRAAYPVAAYRLGGSWTFGTTAGTAPARLTLAGTRGGTLLAQSAGPSGPLRMLTPTGFPLDRILPMIGMTPQLRDGESLHLSGLPAGLYSISVGTVQKSATVMAGKTAISRFE